MASAILSFFAAFAISSALAPFFGRVALRLGVVDAPDGRRKLHGRRVPLTGGPTILLTSAISVAIVLTAFPTLLEGTNYDRRFLGYLFAAGCVIVALGLIDDRFGMRGRQKLAGQILAAAIMLPAGIIIEKVTLFGMVVSFGDFAPLVTMLVLVGAINALNLIDGVDGLASTTGIILALSMAVVSFLYGRPDGQLISLILAGALCGFLIYNFPPARMFLGDSGSMLIGLMLGAIALKCSMKQYAAATLLMPTAIWAIPLFDVMMAIVRRKLTGRSIYETDRGHLHHCLERRGVSGARLLLMIAGLCSLTGSAAILASLWSNDLIAAIGIVTALSLLVMTRSFGHTEMSLLTTRFKRLGGSMLKRNTGRQAVMHDEKIQLNGNRDWQRLWSTLTEFAERFDMDAVQLMVHLPQLDEAYHASWKKNSNTDAHETWKSNIPLMVDGMNVGHIQVTGAVGEGSICKWMSDLIGGLEAFEAELVSLIHDARREHQQKRNPAPVVARKNPDTGSTPELILQ